MKPFLGVFFLYWLTGLSAKPILACDQHTGPHDQWVAFVNAQNAKDAAKAAEAAKAKTEKGAAEAKAEAPPSEVRSVAPRARARVSASTDVISIRR